jgi:hypothetical protein
VFRCVLGSEGCVFVPRSSGTPVATWAWPTRVVSQRRVLEAAFILLKFSSPSRRIFIGSHSLPPSLVRRIGPSACSPALRPPQLTAASLAADHRRSRFLPNQPHQVTVGEFKPHPSSSLAGVRPSLAAGQPCSAAGDLIVISVFDRGALLQNDILGFRVESLSLVKSI